MVEFIKIFPDEVQRFIFVPILNIELKDVTLVTIIVNTFDQQRKAILLKYVYSCEMYNYKIHNYYSVIFRWKLILFYVHIIYFSNLYIFKVYFKYNIYK